LHNNPITLVLVYNGIKLTSHRTRKSVIYVKFYYLIFLKYSSHTTKSTYYDSVTKGQTLIKSILGKVPLNEIKVVNVCLYLKTKKVWFLCLLMIIQIVL